MTDNKQDANPLDDLIAEIIDAQGTSGSMCQAVYNEGLRDAADIVNRNRPRIEAGLQKPLRFEQRRVHGGRVHYGIPVGNVFFPAELQFKSGNGDTHILTFWDKAACKNFAKFFKRTAVFEEEKDDENT